MCHWMLACGTLHTAPTFPTVTVLEETLKADLVASITPWPLLLSLHQLHPLYHISAAVTVPLALTCLSIPFVP